MLSGEDDQIAEWNASAAGRWNHLRTLLRREFPSLEFFRAAEVQKRSALHHHVLALSLEPIDAAVVQELALRAGYGCVLDVEHFADLTKAARYLSKYVTKDAERNDCPWVVDKVDASTGELTRCTRATFRPWSASRRWGLTMTQLRALHAAARQASIVARQSVTEVAGVTPAAAITGGSDPPAPWWRNSVEDPIEFLHT